MQRRVPSSARRALPVVLVVLVVLAACNPAEPEPEPSAAASPDLIVQVASYDLAIGTQRFMVGVVTPEQELVGWGEIAMRFAYLGDREQQTSGEVVSTATGGYLPIPDASDVDGAPQDGPTIVPGAEGRGVYAAEVTFDQAGFWGVEVTADVDGDPATGQATFEVAASHSYPSTGDEAPRTENLTLPSPDAPLTAVDSRAQDGQVPDPRLHSMTVAEAIANGKPTLVVVSTPVYCVSRFCGPVTDMVDGLAADYSDVANFVHLEVWRDFDNQVVNEAAAQWVLRNNDLFEPWVFLVGPGGKIEARWDNVATRSEIEPFLQDL